MSLASISESVCLLPAAAVVPSPRQAVVDDKTLAFETLIQQAGHRGLKDVRVLLLNGLIVLQGSVASYYLKQLAQEAVRPLATGKQICNELLVL